MLTRFTIGLGIVGVIYFISSSAATAGGSCVDPRLQGVSNAARTGTKVAAGAITGGELPAAGTIAGRAYDAAQCASTKYGAKLQDWAAEQRRQAEQRRCHSESTTAGTTPTRCTR
jgi:hypothetical protein